MNRQTAKSMIAQIAGENCIDDVVCMLREYVKEQGEEMKNQGFPQEAESYFAVYVDLCGVANRGI